MGLIDKVEFQPLPGNRNGGLGNHHFNRYNFMTRSYEEDKDEDDGSWTSVFGKMNCGFKAMFVKAGEAVGHVSEKLQETSIG